MKKLFAILLALVLLCMSTACFAEASGVASVEEADTPELLTCDESVVPFYPLQWGIKLKDVISSTGGEDMNNKADVLAPVAIPGIDEPVDAVFHCGKKGLESVSVTLPDKVNLNVDYKDTDSGAALFDCVEAFFESLDTNSEVRLNAPVSKIYRTRISDALVGYLDTEQGKKLMLEFYRPIDFDQAAFRKSNRFYMTTESNGDMLFFNDTKVMTGFDVQYSRSSRYDRSMNVIASKLRLQGSSINPTYSVPCYGIVYAYAGTVKPEGATTMIFTVDGTMYQFTGVNTTSLSLTEYKEYTQQYTIWMCGDDISFMEALEKSKKAVKVELRGNGFSLVFDLPQKAKTGLVTDWKMFKKANGMDPAFVKMLESVATPMAVY